jgi:hypothetical protein
MTTRAMMSAIQSGSAHQLRFHDSSQRIIWERRKIGVTRRQMWKRNDITVIIGRCLMFALAKGIIQCRIERRLYLRLK